jgi:hypothetical protein
VGCGCARGTWDPRARSTGASVVRAQLPTSSRRPHAILDAAPVTA